MRIICEYKSECIVWERYRRYCPNSEACEVLQHYREDKSDLRKTLETFEASEKNKSFNKRIQRFWMR